MLESLVSFVVSFLSSALVNFLRGWLSDLRAAKAEREAGGAEAREVGQKQEDEALQQAGQAIDEARARHRADPTDGAFKNTEFRD